jgi:nitrous oxide reductase accessory protein NosL
MKKRVSYCLAVLVVFLGWRSAFAQEDLRLYPECKHCGMDRKEFAHSRMLIEYEDGSVAATCSLHCAALDLAQNKGKSPKSIRKADYNTKALVAAEKAAWVIGGSRPGVMTQRAKWAFETSEDAARFRAANGGDPADFGEAFKAAYEEINPGVRRAGIKPVQPAEKDKCPVCGMFVAKYPDFLAEIIFEDGSYAVFDGTKDLFKCYLNLKKYLPSKEPSSIDSIYVTDYYKLALIDAYRAVYVIGSDVYGPMGKELVPFEAESDARTFLNDHKGHSLMNFEDITAELMEGLKSP